MAGKCGRNDASDFVVCPTCAAFRRGVEEAVAEEREECANIAFYAGISTGLRVTFGEVAAAIRARGGEAKGGE
jgi:hypothetical protein